MTTLVICCAPVERFVSTMVLGSYVEVLSPFWGVIESRALGCAPPSSAVVVAVSECTAALKGWAGPADVAMTPTARALGKADPPDGVTV